MKKWLGLLVCGLLLSLNASAQKYRVAWSHYTGWEPWAYAQQSGILK